MNKTEKDIRIRIATTKAKRDSEIAYWREQGKCLTVVLKEDYKEKYNREL